MGKKISSRNKDGESFFLDDGISIYHAALKLTDVDQETKQPYINNNITISFVGEIYNKQYLLELLGLEGSFTELEIISGLFNRYGATFSDFLNGEFVIFIFDKINNVYYLFRDRYGVHSIYYTIIEGGLYFSSEIKSLIFDENIKLNKYTIIEYLTFQFSISPNTLIKGIDVLEPGSFLKFHNGKYCIQEFGKYKKQDNKKTFIETLENSIKRRIPFNINRIFVPLSGGADSNLVLYFLNKHFKGDIIVYTFINKNNIKDVEIAKKNVRKYGYQHLIINVDNLLKQDFYDNIRLHEGLVKIPNIGKILRDNYPEFKDINIEFTGDGREELLLLNNHYNYKEIALKYSYFYKLGKIKKYIIDQEFLNLKMFDFNLQLIEKLTLNSLIERRIPFTDYELLEFKGYKYYKKEAKFFLNSKGIDIVEGIYGHNDGIGFNYLLDSEVLKYLKKYIKIII